MTIRKYMEEATEDMKLAHSLEEAIASNLSNGLIREPT